MSDPDGFFTGGAPSVKFPAIGTSVTGTVLDCVKSQQKDIEGKPKFYDDGNPMEQVEITILTEERDPEINNDDGSRRLFVKGNMRFAIGQAVRRAGASGAPKRGGRLTVTFVSEQASQKRGFSPAKQYDVEYTPPVTSSVGAQSSQFEDEEPF